MAFHGPRQIECGNPAPTRPVWREQACAIAQWGSRGEIHVNGLPRGNPTEASDANVTGQRMLASLEQGAAMSSVGQMPSPRQTRAASSDGPGALSNVTR